MSWIKVWQLLISYFPLGFLFFFLGGTAKYWCHQTLCWIKICLLEKFQFIFIFFHLFLEKLFQFLFYCGVHFVLYHVLNKVTATCLFSHEGRKINFLFRNFLLFDIFISSFYLAMMHFGRVDLVYYPRSKIKRSKSSHAFKWLFNRFHPRRLLYRSFRFYILFFITFEGIK